MSWDVKHGGSWKSAEVHVKHGGVWKKAAAYVKDGGVWKQLTFNVTHVLSPASFSQSGSSDSYTFYSSSIVTGGSPSGRTWGILSSVSGTFTIVGSGENATINVTDIGEFTIAEATIYCDAVVDGVTYRATAYISYARGGV